jgi:hypothetical protein
MTRSMRRGDLPRKRVTSGYLMAMPILSLYITAIYVAVFYPTRLEPHRIRPSRSYMNIISLF